MLERLLDSLIQPFAGDVFITVQSKYQCSALVGSDVPVTELLTKSVTVKFYGQWSTK